MKLFIISLAIVISLGGCSERPEPPSENTATPAIDTTGVLPDSLNAQAYDRETNSSGQLVYVPVYSHIYQQDGEKNFNLTATLSIRNTDPFRSLSVHKVAYYDSHGELIQHYLDRPITLAPQSSTSYVVEEKDLRGGVGANFLVSWHAEAPVNIPVVEAVMISTSQQQGVSFLSEGRILHEY